MAIYILNNDPFGNNVKVIDKNAGNAEVFNGFIAAHQSVAVGCRINDSGYANIATSEDGKPFIGRSFLKDGDTVSL